MNARRITAALLLAAAAQAAWAPSSAAPGSESLRSGSQESAALGSATLGSATLGSAALGSGSLGSTRSAASGSAAMESVVLDSAPAGRGPAHSAAMDWRKPWVEPHDARLAATHSDEYAWRLFVALNWPADANRRSADPTAAFGVDKPVVWEVWQNASDVYLDDGSDPGAWATTHPATAVADEARFETFSLKDIPVARHIVGGKMVPLNDPAASAKRLTEIRMNRATFEYIRANELYNLDGQLRLVASGRAVSFPAAATEIKAKWRPIRADERSRYHTVTVRFADGTRRLYGLTALHIVSKALPQWFWATFEHVDNPTLPGADGWQAPSRDRFACATAGVSAGASADAGAGANASASADASGSTGASASAGVGARATASVGADAVTRAASKSYNCNRAPREIGLEGTVWENYRLRGTLTRFVDDTNRPLLLANSELEAGMQQTSSCITCHARSSLGLVAGMPTRLPIFDTSAQSSTTGTTVLSAVTATTAGNPPSSRVATAMTAHATPSSAVATATQEPASTITRRSDTPSPGASSAVTPSMLTPSAVSGGAIERRGYVGLPQARWFDDPSSSGKRLFEQLDFVWSLSKARPRKVPHET